MRLDKLLWFLRLAKTRSLAQERIISGHIRLNGQRVERSSRDVAAGDVLTMPFAAGVVVIEVIALPARRGPASEAQACYRVLDASGQTALASATDEAPLGNPLP